MVNGGGFAVITRREGQKDSILVEQWILESRASLSKRHARVMGFVH